MRCRASCGKPSPTTSRNWYSETGSLAVIAPEGHGLDLDCAVLTPAASKGLEFDVVVLVEPSAIAAGSEFGAADLYVALTRATQRLHIVASQPLPPALRMD
ncbi:ATP-binding domain-containing protein [Nocardia sp. NPDC051570]|uniref:ATP-binding domain-containing protein n=1 Tax=Nocardia sp. NPDC051570 TaxID=3364324 RepID=UPI0037B4AB63